MRKTKRSRGQKSPWIKELVLKRIDSLFEQAASTFRLNAPRARRYMKLAMELSKKYNTTIPKHLKKKMCRKCFTYLYPGITLKVRKPKNKKIMLYVCTHCGAERLI